MARPSALGEAQTRLCYFWSQINPNQERGQLPEIPYMAELAAAVLGRRAWRVLY